MLSSTAASAVSTAVPVPASSPLQYFIKIGDLKGGLDGQRLRGLVLGRRLRPWGAEHGFSVGERSGRWQSGVLAADGGHPDGKSGVEGRSVDLGGRRIINTNN